MSAALASGDVMPDLVLTDEGLDFRIPRFPGGCPLHPEETREERFALLDALIDAGYGEIPMGRIEAIVASLGYLPTATRRPPAGKIHKTTAAAIKNEIGAGRTREDVALKHGVSWATVDNIAEGRSWRNV